MNSIGTTVRFAAALLALAAAGCATTSAPAPEAPAPWEAAPAPQAAPQTPQQITSIAPPAAARALPSAPSESAPEFRLRGAPRPAGSVRYVKRYDLPNGYFALAFYDVQGDSVLYTSYSNYPTEGVKNRQSYPLRNGGFYVRGEPQWCNAIVNSDDCGLQASVAEDAITFTRLAGGRPAANQNNYANENVAPAPRQK